MSETKQQDLPKLNVALLEEAVQWAEFESGKNGVAWHQGSWVSTIQNAEVDLFNPDEDDYVTFYHNVPKNFCGTTFCMAGYALMQTHNLVRDDEIYYPAQEIRGYNGEVVEAEGGEDSVDWIAGGAAVLGLTYSEARQFFDGANNLDLLKELAKSFADARGEYIEIGEKK